MNRRKLMVFGVIVVALALLVTPILGCAKPAAPPAAKPEKFIIHHFGDLSGPYAGITAPLVAGFNDFIAWYNAERGGVDGVPVDQMFRDTGGKLDAALAAYAAFKESKPYPVVMLIYGSAEAEALKERFVEDNIFCFSNSPGVKSLYPVGNQFSTIPGYSDSMGATIDWLADVWAKKTGQKVKLAILTWDNPYGRAILVDETRSYAKQKGVEIVYEGVFGLRDLDVSTQLTAIKAAGANWVYDNTLAHGPGVIHRSASALGMLNQDLYDTTPGKIHRATGPWGMDESAVLAAGALANGVIGPRSFASWAMPEVEGVALAVASADKNNRTPKERVMGYLAVWGEVYTILHCVEKAAKEVGWDKLDGAALKAQFIKLKDYSPLGLTKYTFTADKPEPRATRIFQVQDGKLKPISDWVTCPDLRPAEYKK